MRIRTSRIVVFTIGFSLIFFLIYLYINYRNISQSEAYQKAIEYIRKDEKIYNKIGKVQSFGLPFVLEKNEKKRVFQIPVKGESKEIKVKIEMAKTEKNNWELVYYVLME